MDDLIAYVRAQLDEREQQLEFLANLGITAVISPDGSHVLTEVEFGRRDVAAKRAILDQYEGAQLMAEDDPHDETRSADESTLRFVVRLLAQPYAGREGWREEWTA